MIPKHASNNFETLKRAFENGDVALLEVQRKSDGEVQQAIVAIQQCGDGSGDFEFVPFAILIDGNPYEMYNPPDPDGGFHQT